MAESCEEDHPLAMRNTMVRDMCLRGCCFLLLTLGLSCKEPEITGPSVPDEGDFSYPQLSFNAPTVAFATNRSNNVVYVGEMFEIKVILYSMPEGLFAAGADFLLPESVDLVKILPNPDYLYPEALTLGIVTGNSASYAVVYKSGTSASTAADGVLLKLVCKAISPGEVNLGGASMTNAFFRVTDAGIPVGPESTTEEMSPPPVITTLSITISDEFVGG
jgi:hypothetical protein